MANNILADMTEMLYDQAKKLRDASADDVEREVERAKAMENLSSGVRDNIGTALRIEKFRADYGVETRLLPNG